MSADFKPGQGYTKEDWDDVGDNPEWTTEDFARARPFVELFPEMAASMRKRGPARTKEAVSIRLDTDIVARLRASGPGWQGRVNDVLRRFVENTA